MNYIGSKYSLIDFLEASIDKTLKLCNEAKKPSEMVFADLFAGTGVVSGSFKKQGYKRLNKKQLKEAISSKNLEEIKENSSERKKFKRVSLGGEAGI